METRASHVLIGAFTLAVVALAFGFVLWLAKWQLDREWNYYDVVFKEAVTGLTVGGAVQYNGIQIGEVRRLSLDAADPNQVIAHVRVNSEVPIKVDTRAKLTFTGLTGVAIIQLTGGSPQAARLLGSDERPVPRIIADESALQKLLASSEGVVTTVNDLLLRLSDLLKKEQIEKITATLDHIEQVTGRIADHREDIAGTITQAAQASARLNAALARSERLMQRIEELVSDGRQVLNTDARRVLENAQASLEAARRLAEGANRAIAENQAGISDFSAQAGPALRELRQTLRNLQRLGDALERDPSAVWKGTEQPKEYEAR